MNDAAATTTPATLDSMASRLAEVTGETFEDARQQLRMAIALLAVGRGADPAVVNERSRRYGFWIRQR
jgi:hypothetical protein